jgi:hypothetical protein
MLRRDRVHWIILVCHTQFYHRNNIFCLKSIIYWVVILRMGTYKNINFTTWDDKEIASNGKHASLLEFMRTSVTEFLEIPKIADFILGMVILLCVVIFSELALA